MKTILDVHPVCYYDMLSDEIVTFQSLREISFSCNQTDLSDTLQSEFNKENQRDSSEN